MDNVVVGTKIRICAKAPFWGLEHGHGRRHVEAGTACIVTEISGEIVLAQLPETIFHYWLCPADFTVVSPLELLAECADE